MKKYFQEGVILNLLEKGEEIVNDKTITDPPHHPWFVFPFSVYK